MDRIVYYLRYYLIFLLFFLYSAGIVLHNSFLIAVTVTGLILCGLFIFMLIVGALKTRNIAGFVIFLLLVF